MADEAVSDAAVQAALDAVAPFWKEAHAVLQAYPSAALARAMLEGAAPLIAAERAERAEAKLTEIEAHTPAIVDALRHALSYVEYAPHPSSQTAAERYRSALAIIGTGQERHG